MKLDQFIEVVTRAQKTGNFSYQEKEGFHRTGRAILKKLATALGYSAKSYDIRSNKAGDVFLGDVTLHSDELYVQLGDSSARGRFLWRACKSRKDYSGGDNHWAEWSELSDLNEFARKMLSISCIIRGQTAKAG